MNNVEHPAKRTPAAVSGFCLLVHFALGLMLFSHVWSAVREFDGFPFDGPYQTFNALRRLDDGQRPGRDFVVFHGIGGPLLQYPYFKLLGSDIAASEISKTYLSRLQVLAVVLLFSWLFQTGVCRSLLFWPMALGLDAPLYLNHPASHNLLEFRSLFPLIVAGVIMAPRPIRMRALWIGVSTAFALLCGIEQGMSITIAGLGSVAIAALMSRGKPAAWKALKDTALGLALGIALMLLVWLAIGGISGVRACLKFYLVEIPNDQFWFFGVPPNPVHLGPWSAHRFFTALLALGPAMFLWSSWQYWRSRTEAESRLALGLMTLCGYATLALMAYLGIADEKNLFATTRGLLAAIVCQVVALTTPREAPAAGDDGGYMRTTLFVTLLIGPLVITPLTRRSGQIGFSQAYQNDLAVLMKACGAAPGEAKTGLVWSDFSGMLEGELGIFNPHTDYIIHALGPERRESYLKTFDNVKPEFVVTAGPNFTATPWLWQSFWPFYRQVFLNYDIVGQTRHLHIWKRRATAPAQEKEAAWIDATSLDGGERFQIKPPTAPGKLPLLECKVSYESSNALGSLPVIGKLPRLFVYISGGVIKFPVSLPPYQNEFEFPVFAAGSGPIDLRYGVESVTPGGSLQVHSVQWRVVAMIDENVESILVSPEAKKNLERYEEFK